MIVVDELMLVRFTAVSVSSERCPDACARMENAQEDESGSWGKVDRPCIGLGSCSRKVQAITQML
jgi:hypothetical protein